MKIERFRGCPSEAMWVRKTVFVEEQGFRDEFDLTDDIADHFVMLDVEAPIGTCRVFPDEKSGGYILGRLAVLAQYRGMGLGSDLVSHAESYLREIGAKELRLHAQCRAVSFYNKLGYIEFGEVEYEENCPHIWMKKLL